MNEQDLCKKRLIDLSAQADRKGIVTFSDFLNLNEQNIYHAAMRELYTQTRIYGGYEEAERQMVAFIPDALYYEWEFPIRCLYAEPKHERFAEALTHRDLLGALMHLGIDRGKIGDIVCRENAYYIFCEEGMCAFLTENLTRVKHTDVTLSVLKQADFAAVTPEFETREEQISSNRIDSIVAKAYHLSRSEAAECVGGERVFINGKCVTNGNQPCESGAIVSVRGRGRFLFETDGSMSKKGKLRVTLKLYK